MKTNKIILCSLVILSIISIGSLPTPLYIEKTSSLIKRTPASDGEKNKEKKVEIVTCKSELKGEKLEADLKKLLEDKEIVLKEIEDLKKEKSKLKTESQESTNIISLMSQMTSLISTQMQAQMQLQIQIMNLLTQTQNSLIPQISPYAFQQAHSIMGNNAAYGFENNLAFDSYGIGLQSPLFYPQSQNFQSPYSIMPQSIPQHLLPQMLRQPAQAPMTSPLFQGFDFNQAPMDTIPQMSTRDLIRT